MGLFHMLLYFLNFIVLKLNVGGLFYRLALEEKVMVFQFFLECGLVAPEFVEFDGILGLFFVEGLE